MVMSFLCWGYSDVFVICISIYLKGLLDELCKKIRIGKNKVNLENDRVCLSRHPTNFRCALSGNLLFALHPLLRTAVSIKLAIFTALDYVNK